MDAVQDRRAAGVAKPYPGCQSVPNVDTAVLAVSQVPHVHHYGYTRVHSTYRAYGVHRIQSVNRVRVQVLVGSTDLNFAEIKKFVGRPLDIVAYATSLVPIWARHMDVLVNNQRYYLAINIRNMLSIPYKQRDELVKILTANIRIAGVITGFTPITELVDNCDKDKLIQMLEVKLNEQNA